MCKKLGFAELDIKYMIDDTNQAQMTAIFSIYNSKNKYWWCLVSVWCILKLSYVGLTQNP